MTIDWFTVCAQVVNFLILVWLLKRFLYKPVLRAIDEREKRIAAQVHEAEEKNAEARKEQQELQRKNAEFEQQRSAMLEKALAEADEERRRLLEDARNESVQARARWQETLSDEQETIARDMADRVRQEVVAVSRKALGDLASVTLEERICAVFVQRLQRLGGDDRARLSSALAGASRPAIVRTGFELPPAGRDVVTRTLGGVLGVEVRTEFKVAPELVGGIELLVDGYRVAWNIDEYLTSLSEVFARLHHPEGSPNADVNPA